MSVSGRRAKIDAGHTRLVGRTIDGGALAAGKRATAAWWQTGGWGDGGRTGRKEHGTSTHRSEVVVDLFWICASALSGHLADLS